MHRNNVRGEIQGLRGIAVALVCLFHIYPNAVPGGYVGVDVFFVMSGYLITGLLSRKLLDGASSIYLLDFYSRRARRLLPTATTVLVAALVGTIVILPATRWEEVLVQIAASSLYVQNWALAAQSVDYLNSENLASPVQHYWSLSIEEQFYLVWPVLMMLVSYTANRCRFSIRKALIMVIFIVFVISLSASILLTEPAREIRTVR